MKGLLAEPAITKLFAKLLNGLSAHRFGPVKSNTPTTQIQAGFLFGTHFARTKAVSKIRPSTRSCLVLRDDAQPARWILHKSRRREQETSRSSIERLQDPADEPHVMAHWKPAHDYGRLILPEDVADCPFISKNVVMADDYAFWIAS